MKELADLVEGVQIHSKCNSTCTRFVKKGNKMLRICRFGFPRKPAQEMVIHSPMETVQSRARPEKMVRLVEPARKPSEALVNPYCPLLLLMTRSNVDVQFVGEQSESIIKYTAKYTTKPDSQVRSQLPSDFLDQVGEGSYHSQTLRLAFQVIERDFYMITQIYFSFC